MRLKEVPPLGIDVLISRTWQFFREEAHAWTSCVLPLHPKTTATATKKNKKRNLSSVVQSLKAIWKFLLSR
jgi:hypothetical protein